MIIKDKTIVIFINFYLFLIYLFKILLYLITKMMYKSKSLQSGLTRDTSIGKTNIIQ